MYKVVITAGGTSERIDNVRKITNSASGKLGSIIASKLLKEVGDKIEKIYYVCSKNAIKPIGAKIETIEVFDTNALEVAIRRLLKEENIDLFIHSMAVSDYTVDYVTTAESLVKAIENNSNNVLDIICNFKDKLTDYKISSEHDNLIIKLKKTPKIISLIKDISPNTKLVGFKLLDNVTDAELMDTALRLKEKNGCEWVVANDLSNIRNGEHKAFIIREKGMHIEALGKEDIAEKLVKEIFENVEL